eukprot:TRINITY_DN7150_c0_g1_i1.p1 TRINITY_DN7150_c0_g1~~TRINITY_DN7150_c0_g1_i1.p1  ORF type:complete len:560 (+),score=192.84 TRINITY_DN7150_c0_g1_i1:72-1751(+)
MRGHGGAADTREQLDSLRHKFALLTEDRKAFFDTFEKKKTANEKLVREFKKEINALQKKIQNLRKKHAKESKFNNDDIIERETRRVDHLRNNLDTLAHKTQKLLLEEQRFEDQLADLQLDSQQPALEDTPQTRKIRLLENRLDKAMIKYNEAQSIKRTYEQIVKRLKEERVNFDNQLAAIEKTHAAKVQDLEELKMVSVDAMRAQGAAQTELESVRAQVKIDRQKWSDEIRNKKEMVHLNADLIERRRQKKRPDSPEDPDMIRQHEERDAALSDQMAEKTMQNKEKITVYEQGFRRIKEATGVTDVNEVIQKIISQEDTQKNLVELSKENQSKIETLTETHRDLKAKVEEIKYSGPGGRSGARKMVDDHEENLTTCGAKLERSKLKYERLARLLIDVKAGIDHLIEKINTVPSEEGTPNNVVMNDDTIVDVMYQCEAVLTKMTDTEEQPVTGAGGVKRKLSPRAPSPLANGMSDRDILRTRPFNQRVALRNNEIGEGDLGSDDDDEDVGGEELTREKVKRAASQLLNQQRKKDKKAKRQQHGAEENTKSRRGMGFSKKK